MSLNIRLKHSATKDKKPQAADLKAGELALNTNSASAAGYALDDTGAVQQMFGKATETQEGQAEIATQAEVTTGTDDTRIVTPLKLAAAVPIATETFAGKAKIATQAEVTTGTDDTRIVTPLKLAAAVPVATEALAGKAEIATQAEMTAGTDDTRIVTPLKLATAVPAASTTAPGKAAIATQAEVDTGTNNTKIVTPLTATAAFVNVAGDTMTGDLSINTTGALTIPNGTTGQRPATPSTGALRFNGDSGDGEIYTGTSSGWKGLQYKGGAAGLRNILVNGDLTINQRKVNIASAPTGSYGQDRWKKTAGGMTQIIEAGNFEPGATYTLSGTGVTTQQLTAPSTGNWTLPDIPVTARKIQLESGTVATPFERRPIGTELALCHRYFQLAVNCWTGQTAVGTSYVAATNFAVEMRAAPTMDSPTRGVAVTTGNAPGFYTRNTQLLNAKQFSVVAQCILTSSGNGWIDIWSADAEL